MRLFRDFLKRRDFNILSGLVLLTLAVYVRVAWHDFLNYDDPFIVTMNENIRDGFTLNAIRWAFTTSCEGNWIPVSWLSHMLDIQLFGLNPGGHHFVNVFWHITSTALLFSFLNYATGECWKSGMVASLFALHPLHVESVAWVAERKDVLSAFFWMLTLCLYTKYVKYSRIISYWLCLVSFLLGLLAKPMLVTLPVVLLAVDYWPLGRFHVVDLNRGAASVRHLLLEKMPFVVLAIIVCVITYVTQKNDGSISENYTVASRSGKALVYYVAYLGKTVWPTGLSVFYPRSLYPFSSVSILGAAALLVAVSYFVVKVRSNHGFLFIGWAWYLITLVPVIGFVQIGSHSIADRYTYIPLVGIFIAVVWGISDLFETLSSGSCAPALLSCIIILILVIVTSLQLGYWKNSITLFSHAIGVTENNQVALTNLGNALLQDGKYKESIPYLLKALENRPADTFALLNLGNAYSHLNEHEKAIASYVRVMQLEPRSEKGHYELGVEYLIIGQKSLAAGEYMALRDLGSKRALKLLEQMIRVDSNAVIVR